MNYKNSKKLWSENEDRFLIQQMSLGMNAKQIYDHYGDLIGRTEKAIECRISYLNKPQRERIKGDCVSHYEKEIQILEKALDKACEELENFSYCTTDPGFELMSFDEWKEWCMKDE